MSIINQNVLQSIIQSVRVDYHNFGDVLSRNDSLSIWTNIPHAAQHFDLILSDVHYTNNALAHALVYF